MPRLGCGVYQVDPAECERCVLDAISVGYRAMEEAYRAGRIRTIGVSNFYPDRLIDLCQFVEVPPAVNQVETHVFQQQARAHGIMEKYHVQHQSAAPFAGDRSDFFNNAALNGIGKKYGKSAAQAALRFLLQSDAAVIPKSTHKERHGRTRL